MNLEGIRTRLEDLYGPAATDESSYYDRIINDAYKDLCAITDWWFLEKHAVITTSAYVRTVDVYVTNGSSTLEPSSSSGLFLDEYDNGWLSTGEHIYRILDASNSVGEIIIDSEWLEATADSALLGLDAEVSIWQDTFDLPSDFDKVLGVYPRHQPGKMPLRQVDPIDLLAKTPDVSDEATEFARIFCVYRETDKTSRYRIRIYPPPSTEAEYLVRYIALPDDLTSSSDEAYLPEKYHSVLSDYSKLRLMKDRREDPDVIQNCEIEVQKGLRRMWKAQERSSSISYKFGRRGHHRAQRLDFKTVNVTTDSP